MMTAEKEGSRLPAGPVTLQVLLSLVWRKPDKAKEIADKVAEVMSEIAQHNMTVGEGEDELRDTLEEASVV